MSDLNYVPSWLDSAMTLLEKLNKCIEKIETIVNTVVSVTKTADDALSLAKANQVSIGLNETEITALQNKTATLETNVTNAANKADNAFTEATLANTTANNAQVAADEATAKANTNATNITALQTEKQNKFKLYLANISLDANDENRSLKISFMSETKPTLSQFVQAFNGRKLIITNAVGFDGYNIDNGEFPLILDGVNMSTNASNQIIIPRYIVIASSGIKFITNSNFMSFNIQEL